MEKALRHGSRPGPFHLQRMLLAEARMREAMPPMCPAPLLSLLPTPTLPAKVPARLWSDRSSSGIVLGPASMQERRVHWFSENWALPQIYGGGPNFLISLGVFGHLGTLPHCHSPHQFLPMSCIFTTLEGSSLNRTSLRS